MGDSIQFTATGNYSDGSTKDITASSNWASSAETAATINSNGLASGGGSGTTTITVIKDARSASTVLTVYRLDSINISPLNSSISLGSNQQFTAIGNYADGSSIDITNKVTWNSSASPVATISNIGLAVSKGSGTTTITAINSARSASTVLTVTTGNPSGNSYTVSNSTDRGQALGGDSSGTLSYALKRATNGDTITLNTSVTIKGTLPSLQSGVKLQGSCANGPTITIDGSDPSASSNGC